MKHKSKPLANEEIPKNLKAAAENNSEMSIKALNPTEEVHTCLMNSQ